MGQKCSTDREIRKYTQHFFGKCIVAGRIYALCYVGRRQTTANSASFKRKALPTKQPRQIVTKYCRWKTLFVIWAVEASLPARPHPVIPLVGTSNGRQASTIDRIVLLRRILKNAVRWRVLDSNGPR